MTKDECAKALNALYFSDGTDDRDDGCYNVLMGLINEHFDNPPLKFEELEVGMWVWDNKEKRYSKIESFAWIQIYFYDYTDDFEENRFYRKQVEE